MYSLILELELWSWFDKDVQKKTAKGKAKKICHKSIKRGDEIISVCDLSTTTCFTQFQFS